MNGTLEVIRFLNAALAIGGVIGVVVAHLIYVRQVARPDRIRVLLLMAIAVGCLVFAILTIDSILQGFMLTWRTVLIFALLVVFLVVAIEAARDRSYLQARRRSTDRRATTYERR